MRTPKFDSMPYKGSDTPPQFGVDELIIYQGKEHFIHKRHFSMSQLFNKEWMYLLLDLNTWIYEEQLLPEN